MFTLLRWLWYVFVLCLMAMAILVILPVFLILFGVVLLPLIFLLI